ncbi:hypothetical protein J6590_055437 [Homalodisca vitripennis]|nr:hypothetical protein J6590_055437 [Homalodisca vitripennis]
MRRNNGTPFFQPLQSKRSWNNILLLHAQDSYSLKGTQTTPKVSFRSELDLLIHRLPLWSIHSCYKAEQDDHYRSDSCDWLRYRSLTSSNFPKKEAGDDDFMSGEVSPTKIMSWQGEEINKLELLKEITCLLLRERKKRQELTSDRKKSTAEDSVDIKEDHTLVNQAKCLN